MCLLTIVPLTYVLANRANQVKTWTCSVYVQECYSKLVQVSCFALYTWPSELPGSSIGRAPA